MKSIASMKSMKSFSRLIAACAASAAAVASGQAAQDPANADAPVAKMPYRSPFHGYRPLAEIKQTPWRIANDEVARIGGWRVYAREAQPSLPPASAKPAGEAAAALPEPKAEPSKPSRRSGHKHDH